MENWSPKRKQIRFALTCSLLLAFLFLVFLPSLFQQSTIGASAYSASSTTSDILAVNNPCSWWWGCQTNKYDSIVLTYSSTWHLPDPMVIKAEIALESGFHPTAKAWNPSCGSYDEGLMQVNPTCNGLSASLLLEAGYNVNHASEIWASNYQYLLKKWGSSCGLKKLIMGALELYNQGPQGAGSSCGSFPHGTTYANNVLNDYYYPFCKDSGYKPKF